VGKCERGNERTGNCRHTDKSQIERYPTVHPPSISLRFNTLALATMANVCMYCQKYFHDRKGLTVHQRNKCAHRNHIRLVGHRNNGPASGLYPPVDNVPFNASTPVAISPVTYPFYSTPILLNTQIKSNCRHS
jgi:hypothetical protein